MCADVFSSKKIRRDTKIVYAITVTFDCRGSYKSSAYHWLNAGLSSWGWVRLSRGKRGEGSSKLFLTVPLGRLPQKWDATDVEHTEILYRKFQEGVRNFCSNSLLFPEHLSKLFKRCIQLSVWGHEVSSSTGDKSESPRLRASQFTFGDRPPSAACFCSLLLLHYCLCFWKEGLCSPHFQAAFCPCDKMLKINKKKCLLTIYLTFWDKISLWDSFWFNAVILLFQPLKA